MSWLEEWVNKHQASEKPKLDCFQESGLLKLNCDKALHQLKWLPTLDYSDMIRLTSEWYREFYSGCADIYSFTMDQIASYELAAKKRDLPWTE